MAKRIKGALVFVSTLSLVGIIALSIALSLAQSEVKAKNRIIENDREKSFYLMCDSVNNLETDLSKLMVAKSSGESLQIIQDAHTHANGALDGYSGLDVDMEKGFDTYRFFNQVSDWSNSYARATVEGECENYKNQAYSLYLKAKGINDKLKEIAGENDGYKKARTTEFLTDSNNNQATKNSVEYPSLIYDGPFSDEQGVRSHMLENKREITNDEAIKVATVLLNMKNAKVVGSSFGDIEAYELEGNVNGLDAYASITKKGGYVYNFICNYNTSEGDLSEKECGEIGKRVLAKLGYDYMQPVWYNEIQNNVYVNFAPVVGGITYYTDLIKMRINKNGEVEAIEAKGYVSSYKTRDYSAKINTNDALLKADGLNVKSVNLAVIPFGKSEAFCYEIYAEKYGLDYYLYVDAQTGVQREILRVVDSAQGRKAM